MMEEIYPSGKNFKRYLTWSMFEPFRPYFAIRALKGFGTMDEYYEKLRRWKSKKPPLYANAQEYKKRAG